MLIIDRFEGEYAVCEENAEGKFRRIPKVLLPTGVREGDCLIPAPDGEYRIDAAETLRRRAEIKRRLDNLYQR